MKFTTFITLSLFLLAANLLVASTWGSRTLHDRSLEKTETAQSVTLQQGKIELLYHPSSHML